MNKIKITYTIIFLLGFASISHPQAIERIFVEKYGIVDSLGANRTYLPNGAKTYRIFVDLAPGYSVQTIFGYPNHELIIETTTKFYNHPFGGIVGDEISDLYKSDMELALDSWLTIGASGKKTIGIPLQYDTDGSVLKDIGFEKSDGLLSAPTPSIIKYNFDIPSLEGMGGNRIYANNSLLGVLGGVTGPTEENIILLAQLTTDGELYFELNLQLGTEECGESFVYVARNAQEGEILHEGLIYGTPVFSKKITNHEKK